MKKIIINLLIITTSVINLKGQDSLNKLQLGIDFAIGNNAIGKGNILPTITLSKGKHVVFMGPTFIYGLAFNPYRPIYGVQAGYQIYPNGRRNRFNLFFEYDFNYMKGKFQKDYYSYYSKGIKKSTTVFSSLDNYLGFGFRLNLIKSFYFKTNVGLGVIVYDQNTTEEYYDGTTKNYNYGQQIFIGKFPSYFFAPFFNEYYFNYGQMVGIFKMGIGCDLCSFKKKTKRS